MSNNQLVNNGEKRQVGFLLGLGIFFFPVIFVWFLLRKGHSTVARIIGFGYFGLGIILWALIGAAGSGAANNQSTSSGITTTAQEAPPSSEQAAPVELEKFSSDEIEKAYEANTVSADQKYKGKRFVVTGVIGDINTDFTNKPYVVMKSRAFSGPHASFKDGQENEIATLAKGNKIILECTGGGDIAKTPTLRDCVFAQ